MNYINETLNESLIAIIYTVIDYILDAKMNQEYLHDQLISIGNIQKQCSIIIKVEQSFSEQYKMQKIWQYLSCLGKEQKFLYAMELVVVVVANHPMQKINKYIACCGGRDAINTIPN